MDALDPSKKYKVVAEMGEEKAKQGFLVGMLECLAMAVERLANGMDKHTIA